MTYDSIFSELGLTAKDLNTGDLTVTTPIDGTVIARIEGKMFEPFERQRLAPFAVVNDFARITIGVNQSIGAPGQIV